MSPSASASGPLVTTSTAKPACSRLRLSAEPSALSSSASSRRTSVVPLVLQHSAGFGIELQLPDHAAVVENLDFVDVAPVLALELGIEHLARTLGARALQDFFQWQDLAGGAQASGVDVIVIGAGAAEIGNGTTY